MKLGDLVQLNRIYFDVYDDIVGIIVKLDEMESADVPMVKVAWIGDSNGPRMQWYIENELEVINGEG